MAEKPLRHAIFRQQQHPRVGFDDIARPHRQHNGNIEERFPFAAGVTRHIPGHREGQNGAGDGDRNRHHQRTDDDVVVCRVKKCLNVRQRQVRRNRHGEVIKGIKALPQ